jgi:hypothetical protein
MLKILPKIFNPSDFKKIFEENGLEEDSFNNIFRELDKEVFPDP